MNLLPRRKFLQFAGGVAACRPALSLANTSSADPGLGSIAPIDVIGIQSHLATEYNWKLDDRSLADFLKKISDRGLKIMITELDVVDRASPSDIPTRDADVAALYKRYLDGRSRSSPVTKSLSDLKQHCPAPWKAIRNPLPSLIRR
jgi:hypothetical protein